MKHPTARQARATERRVVEVCSLAVLAFFVAPWAANASGAPSNTVGMRLVPIQPGEFVMGQDGAREESPAHGVRISKPYSLAATEVTRGQWKAVMGAEPPDTGGVRGCGSENALTLEQQHRPP
jgi:formylglycine-generating enzyme required for sulfatase activity